jgi:hypothetical protein
MAFHITRKSLVARLPRSRTASIICGVLFLTPLANVVSAADSRTVVDGILGEAIPAIQSQMVPMSEGCSGGPHGRPPVGWGALQVHGNTAVNAFSDARTALATGQTAAARQQICQVIGSFHEHRAAVCAALKARSETVA